MRPVSPFHPVHTLQTVLAAALFIGMAGTVLAALGFQYIGGLMPCSLCLMERMPYYIGVILMLVTAVFSAMRLPGICVRGLFLTAMLVMLCGFVLSVYHAGAEWKFWPGPTECAAPGFNLPENAGSLLDSINTVRPVSCSEAAGYFIGLSMAGWNALASLGFAAAAAFAALTACERKISR